MRASPNRHFASNRALIGLGFAAAGAGPFLACLGCGLSLSGLGPLPGGGADASLGGPGAVGRDASASGAVDGSADSSPPDASPSDSPSSSDPDAGAGDAGADALADAWRPCVPSDAGVGGPLDLSRFVLAGNASYNENSDGKITLTNSNNNENGAGWYPAPLPAVAGYDLTWALRVGPNNVAGDGVTFAVLVSGSVPGVGDKGDGLGLRNIGPSTGGGGPLAGYAVDVDMYKNAADPTDLGVTTLKLVKMPGFQVVAATAVATALNDGNVYPVDVSWRAPSSLTATLHAPGGALVKVTSSDPGLTAGSAYIGFTGATGGTSDSHNEIAGITVASTCE